MKNYIAIIVTMLTGIGGHFINRRWDRALLFFSLIILWLVFCGFLFLMKLSMQTDEVLLLSNDLTIMYVGATILWITSILVTTYDAFKVDEKLLHNWTVGGVTGAFFTSALSSLLLIYCVSLAFNQYPLVEDDFGEPISSDTRIYSRSFFSEYIYFGKTNQNHELPLPPKGDAYLTGRFMYKDSPAEGVELTVVLNNQYESESVITDKNGVFNLRVPAGTWYVNVIKTKSWSSKPTEFDDYEVIIGDEINLSTDKTYTSYKWRDGQGKKIIASSNPSSEPLTLTIRENVILNWPDKNNNIIDITSAIASWEPLDGANQYLVQISKIDTLDNGWSSRVISSRHVKNETKLAMSKFKTFPTEEDDLEYSITVYAFDDNGVYLSESIGHGYSMRFKLNDQIEIVDEGVLSANSTSSDIDESELTELYVNRGRLNAVIVLIDEGLLEEADALIDKIIGRSQLGKLEAAKGYLAAKRGECNKANELFSLAKKLGGDTCVPAKYQESCQE